MSSVTPCEDTVDMKRAVMRCYCSGAVTNISILHFKKAASHPLNVKFLKCLPSL